MAAQSTTLTQFSTLGNSRTSTIAGHTSTKPKLVIEKRSVPSQNANGNIEYSFKVLEATEDADGNVLTSKVTFEAIVRYPVLGQSAEIAAGLAVFRDIVAGDEFGNSVLTQMWL